MLLNIVKLMTKSVNTLLKFKHLADGKIKHKINKMYPNFLFEKLNYKMIVGY